VPLRDIDGNICNVASCSEGEGQEPTRRRPHQSDAHDEDYQQTRDAEHGTSKGHVAVNRPSRIHATIGMCACGAKALIHCTVCDFSSTIALSYSTSMWLTSSASASREWRESDRYPAKIDRYGNATDAKE
jgi:hypothetical protein